MAIDGEIENMSFGFVAAIRVHDLSADGWHEVETFSQGLFAAQQEYKTGRVKCPTIVRARQTYGLAGSRLGICDGMK